MDRLSKISYYLHTAATCNKNLPIILFSILLTIVFSSYTHYGVGWDEWDQRRVGKLAYEYYISGGKNLDYFNAIPAKGAMLSRGHIPDLIAYISQSDYLSDSYEDYHLILALLNVFSFIFIYKIFFVLTKKVNFSALSTLLLYFMPRYTGHIFNDSKNTIPTMLFLACIYLIISIFKKKKYRLKEYIVLGLLFGAAASLRIILLYIYALFVLFDLILSRRQKRSKSNFLLYHLVLLIVTIVSLYAFTPHLQLNPLTGIVDMIQASGKFAWKGTAFFEGFNYRPANLPWYYLPKWILISTPIITLLFISVELLYLLKRFRDGLYINIQRKDVIHLFIIVLLFFPIIFVILLKANIYDAWIHLTFLSAPLAILAGTGFYRLYISKNSAFKKIGLLLFFTNIILVGSIMLSLHPYEYVYFNEFVGGLKGASAKYDIEMTGRSHKDSVMWLINNKIDQSKKYKIHTCGHPTSSTYYFKENMKWVDDLKIADYFICYTRKNRHNKNIKLGIPYKTVYSVSRYGVDFNVVKERIK